MKREQTTPDWAEMIDQMVAKGLTLKQVGDSMSCEITTRMLNHYRSGAQPMHWRGEGLIALWCKTMEMDRQAVPTMLLVRGHRVDRNRPLPTGPQVQRLPDWPKAAPATVNPLKARKRKEVA